MQHKTQQRKNWKELCNGTSMARYRMQIFLYGYFLVIGRRKLTEQQKLWYHLMNLEFLSTLKSVIGPIFRWVDDNYDLGETLTTRLQPYETLCCALAIDTPLRGLLILPVHINLIPASNREQARTRYKATELLDSQDAQRWIDTR